ncbi:YraN family protein [Goodfellowiella coeruleoviolacea]|uniref:YraN family protein n=1 Tax=Goodfellowiella coeruleoviolacea TaxID=334858 RepID=UPI0027E034C1|nr:YraN family protein [Goodfellowiella coeruleoviolacea]
MAVPVLPPHPAVGQSSERRARGSAASAALGRRGEALAAQYLESQGLVVLSRNWRCREGELDLVATDGVRLVVCEVKTRSSDWQGDPAQAVDRAKLRRLRRLAGRWLTTFRVGWCEIRFDVIAVHWPPSGPIRLRHRRGVS